MPNPEQTPSAASLANLKPSWKPGETGNPKGRPKGRSITTLLREVLDRETLDGVKPEPGKDIAQMLAEAMVVHAINGNATYMKEIMERLEGKVQNDVQVSGVTKIEVEYIEAPVADAMILAGLQAMGLDTGPEDEFPQLESDSGRLSQS